MKLSVGKKLSIGFSIMIVLMLIVGGFALSRMSHLNSNIQEINTSWMPGVENINNLNYLTDHVATITLRHVFNIGKKSELEQERKNTLAAINTALDNYEKTIFLPEDRKNFNLLKEKWQSYLVVNEKIIELSNANDTKGAISNLAEGKKRLDSMQTNLNTLVKINRDGSNKAAAESTNIFNFAIWLITFLLVIAVLIGIAATFFLIRMITKPLVLVTDRIGRIADGDLTVEPLHIKNNDEIGKLAQSFNQMKQNLQTLLRKVSETSEQVAASSEELYASSEQSANAATQVAESVQDISRSADAQMNSMEENKIAMEESSVGLQHIAESASTVSESSAEVLKVAEQGNQVIKQTVVQMEEINQAVQSAANVIQDLGENSKRIGQIIEVISDIANQTNLLALNAAIEAARAGEHGKGFAVVADEVRKLAEQSKQSSEEIASLIQGIQDNTTHVIHAMDKGTEEVKSGSAIVAQAGDAFQHILSSFNKWQNRSRKYRLQQNKYQQVHNN